MADDEGEYASSFVQVDDATLMAAIQQRDASVTPLLTCVTPQRLFSLHSRTAADGSLAYQAGVRVS